jgi:hypothetical protein
MRSCFVSCFLAFVFAGFVCDRLAAADPRLWSGFPALENGDANADGDIDLSDGIHILSWLYLGGTEPAPIACATAYSHVRSGDVNADGGVDVSDAVRVLNYLFASGPAPAAACGLADGAGAAGNPNPRVLPPHASAYGKTLGEWSAAWWQWAISIPVTAHPLFETAGCDTAQSGKVWFLGGAFTGTATTRECSVPLGKAILFPVINVECSTVEPPPFFGANEEELRECADAFQDTAFDLSATVDGRDIQNLDAYRTQSPLFEFSAPADNVLFIPGPVSGESVSDGVWILLAPLSSGEHVIHFAGSFPGFPIDVTYNITVE